MAEKDTIQLFFPYYVNQGRLLDIYAILNGGYSEYSEISTSVSTGKTKGAKGETTASAGFKLLDLGMSASGNYEKTDSQTNKNKEKKVQTVTSMLSIVRQTLETRGYLQRDILKTTAGQFVCMPVVLSINSIKALFEELSELLKLAGNLKKLGAEINSDSTNIKNVENTINMIQVLFSGEEILYETDTFAIISNIVDSNLYQSVRSDIIGTQLTCLAQVKRIFPEGTELMKNTIFTKIKGAEAKAKLVNAIQAIISKNTFDFEATAVPSIYGKPVYQLEIIALYQ